MELNIVDMDQDFTNFSKWERATTDFIRDTQGFYKPPISPVTQKNQKLSELIQLISDDSEVDRNRIISELTKILLIGQ